MKIITKELVKFSITATILCILFRFLLSMGIQHQSILTVSIVPALYGLSMGISGWYLGFQEYKNLPILDSAFRFHCATFIIHNGISLLWIVFKLYSVFETIIPIYYMLIIWSPLLLLHFYFYLKNRKRAIKGLDKDQIFE